MGYTHSTRETKSSSVSIPKKCARTQQVILLALGLIVVVGAGNHLVREAAKERRERNEHELFEIQLNIDKICLKHAIKALALDMKFYYVRELFVDPEFEFNALEHKFHTECSKLKLDVTKDVFQKIASGLDRDRYDMIRRRRELNDIFAKGTAAEKQIERDFVVKMVDLKRKHLEVDYMGALTDPIFDE